MCVEKGGGRGAAKNNLQSLSRRIPASPVFNRKFVGASTQPCGTPAIFWGQKTRQVVQKKPKETAHHLPFSYQWVGYPAAPIPGWLAIIVPLSGVSRTPPLLRALTFVHPALAAIWLQKAQKDTQRQERRQKSQQVRRDKAIVVVVVSSSSKALRDGWSYSGLCTD